MAAQHSRRQEAAPPTNRYGEEGVEGLQIELSCQIQQEELQGFSGNLSTGDAGSSSVRSGFQVRKG